MWTVCNRCTVCNVTYDLLRLCKKGRTTAPICHLLLILKRPWGGVTGALRGEHKGADRAKVDLHCIYLIVISTCTSSMIFFLRTMEFYFVFPSLTYLDLHVSESGLKKFSIAVSYLPYNKIGLTVTRYAQTVFPFKYHQRYTLYVHVYTLYVYYNHALDVWNLKSWIN